MREIDFSQPIYNGNFRPHPNLLPEGEGAYVLALEGEDSGEGDTVIIRSAEGACSVRRAVSGLGRHQRAEAGRNHRRVPIHETRFVTPNSPERGVVRMRPVIELRLDCSIRLLTW